MPAQVLDLPLLKTFVMVVEDRSLTKVAARIGRTQPAVSLQLRRLESLLGKRIFAANLRALRLTQDGEKLLEYARRILALHDDAIADLTSPSLEGRVLLGCPDLYAGFLLPPILSGFRKSFPNVEVTVRCALSSQLADEMSEEKLDLAIATDMPGVRPTTGVKTALGKETLAWFGAAGGSAYREDPLPLAMLPEGNLYRDRALSALRARRRDMRIACISESIAGLHAMTAADNAVTVLSARVSLPGVRLLGPRDGLPPLRGVDLVLWQRRPGLSDAAQRLARHIIIVTGRDWT